MKKHVVAAFLAAGISLCSNAAYAQIAGTAGLNFDRSSTDLSDDLDLYGLNAGVAIPAGERMAVLIEGGYRTNEYDDFDGINAAAHLINRDASRAWGGFVTVDHTENDVSGSETYGVGGEYAKFFDTSTLAASLGYATNPDVDNDIWALSGEYRWFLNDNLRFDIGAGYSRTETGAFDNSTTRIGAGVEYRFAGTPVSLGGSVRHDDDDADIFGLTLRYDFGLDSLKARDRNGNTFGGLSGLRNFG